MVVLIAVLEAQRLNAFVMSCYDLGLGGSILIVQRQVSSEGGDYGNSDSDSSYLTLAGSFSFVALQP